MPNTAFYDQKLNPVGHGLICEIIIKVRPKEIKMRATQMIVFQGINRMLKPTLLMSHKKEKEINYSLIC